MKKYPPGYWRTNSKNNIELYYMKICAILLVCHCYLLASNDYWKTAHSEILLFNRLMAHMGWCKTDHNWGCQESKWVFAHYPLHATRFVFIKRNFKNLARVACYRIWQIQTCHLGQVWLNVVVQHFLSVWGGFLPSIYLNVDAKIITKTNLHLVHDGICAQDVVLLLRILLGVFDSPCGFSTGGKANHHKDLPQVNGNNSLTSFIMDCIINNYSIKMLMILFF